MGPKLEPQSYMEDTIVEDADLEKMLEERQELKQSVAAYSKLNKDVKAKLSSIETPTPFRVGRFVINRSVTEGCHVEFDAAGGFRFSIKLAGEE